MPNYVKNEITFTGEKETVKKFLSQFESENNSFDFYKIVPIPASFYENSDVSGNLYQSGSVSNKAFEDFINGDYSNTLGAQIAANLIKYKVKDWYDFCRKYWGTKWNSMRTEMQETCDGFKFCFETAWSMPDKIYEAIIEENLNITVFAEWSNEDWCQNSGELITENNGTGIISYCYVNDATDSESAERYIKLWYDDNIEDAGFFKDESGNYISYCKEANCNCENCKKKVKC